MSRRCYCSLTLPSGAMGRYVECDCVISWSYSLNFIFSCCFGLNHIKEYSSDMKKSFSAVLNINFISLRVWP